MAIIQFRAPNGSAPAIPTARKSGPAKTSPVHSSVIPAQAGIQTSTDNVAPKAQSDNIDLDSRLRGNDARKDAALERVKAEKLEARRKAMLGKVHIALDGKKGKPGLYDTLPGFTEDVYRYYLSETFGEETAAALDVQQLDTLLKWLAGLGFQSSTPYFAKRDYYLWRPEALIRRIEELLAEKGKLQQGPAKMEYADGILRQMTRGKVAGVYSATARQLRGVCMALGDHVLKEAKKARRGGRC